jgi:membrane protein YqaA with SNARE-associated domain
LDKSTYQQHWLHQHQKFLTRVTPLLISIVFIATGLVLWTNGSLNVGTVGYASIWFLAFIGAALIFLPVSALAAVCVAVAAADLNPVFVAVTAASAEAIGELTGYLAGMGGKSFFERKRFYLRFKQLFLRYAGLTIVLFSIIPNPLFDIVGVAAGSILYPVRKFLLLVFIGKVVKFSWVGLGCYYGMTWF